MKAKRHLTKDDREAWFAVTRGIEPYHASPVAPAPACATGVASERTVPPGASAPAKAPPSHRPPAFSHSANQSPATRAGDPKLDRRAARGRLPIDATLDLHGFNQAAAHGALRQFLARAKARHHRCVLVITGKGAKSSGPGILRRRFLEWVDERDVRESIARVAQAHQRHGGAGAFYVFLKSSRPQRR